MRDHEDGCAEGLTRLRKAVDDRAGGLGIQIAGRLVGQNEQRVVDERAGDCGALLFAARDFGGVFIPDGGDAEHVAQAVRVIFHAARVFARDDAGQQDVFAHGQAVEQQEVLKYKAQLAVAHLCERVLVQPGELLTAQADAAAVRGDVAGDAVEERGLSRAARPHDGDELAVADFEGHALEHFIGGLADLIGFMQVLYG